MPYWESSSTGLKLVGTEDALRLPWAIRPNEWPMFGRSRGIATAKAGKANAPDKEAPLHVEFLEARSAFFRPILVVVQ